MSSPPPLILASTSRYRQELLGRLRIPFTAVAPEVDETAGPGEPPALLSERLALAKAQAVAQHHPDAAVIGSDQVAELNGQPLGKPGTHLRAIQQLSAMSGQLVQFHTAIALVCRSRALAIVERVPVSVRFRRLSASEIDAYLRQEQPYDCAGSAKSEGLGIALLEAIESNDPTALIGLPLIRTCALLRQAGISVPAATDTGA